MQRRLLDICRFGVLAGLVLCFAVAQAAGNGRQATGQTISNGSKAVAPEKIDYPYPPEELWKRLVKIIGTPVDQFSYQRLEEILGVKFDPELIRRHKNDDGSVAQEYYTATHLSNKKYPFTFQFEIRVYENLGKKLIVFGFEVRDINSKQLDASYYCVKPLAIDLTNLGVHFSKIRSAENYLSRTSHGQTAPRIDYYVASDDFKAFREYNIGLEYSNICLRELRFTKFTDLEKFNKGE